MNDIQGPTDSPRNPVCAEYPMIEIAPGVWRLADPGKPVEE